MADYQRVVEFLRDFRAAPVQTVTDEVRTAATEYAELCASANERLRQCAVLLQRGLRAEAINLAEASPNLLDLVAALDLPDAEKWAEFCQRSDLPVPPPLQIDRAAQLNDAYGQEQPLEELFSTHRRLALAQAPVGKRLAVMRKIAQADPSPFWDKDIRVFEYARFKELRVNFANAVRDKDLKRIMALSTEVLDSPWLETVPDDLRAAARDVDERLRQAQFETAMAELVANLRTAFAAKSLQECADLLNKAKELMANYGRTEAPADAAGDLQTVGAWVREEERLKAEREAFAASLDALTAALDGDAPEATLEAAMRAAQSHGQTVPLDYQERYANTLRRRAKAATRRLLLGLAGIAAILLIALGVGMLVMQSRRAGEWAQKIHKAAADRNLALARETIKDQELRAPKVSEVPSVVAAKGEVAALEKEFDRDKVTLDASIKALDGARRKGEAARAADDNLANAAIANPSAIANVLSDLRDATATIDDVLEQRRHLPNLAWVDPNNSLGAVTGQLQSLHDDLKQRYEHGAVGPVQAVARRAEALTVEPKAASLAAAEAALATMDQELASVRNYADRGEATKALDEAARKIADKREAVRKVREYVDARRALAANIDSSDAAKAALESFARKYPDEPLSRDLLKAATNAELYKSVEAWHQMVKLWLADPGAGNEKAAQQRLESVHIFLQANPATPIAPWASRYADYLQSAADAMAVTNTWQAGMNEVLATPLISDLKYMQTSDGVKHYVLGEVKVRTRTLNDRVTYAFDGMDPANLAKKREVVVVPPVTLVTPKPVPMPHTLFAQSVAEELKTVDASNWDTFGTTLASRIVAEDKIDQVVKGILLRDALVASVKVDSWTGVETYDKPANDLVRQKLDQVVWWDPDRPVPPATIANLQRIFAEVPKAADVKQKIAAKRDELFKSLRPKFAGEGLLLRDENGKWVIETPAALNPGTTALVIVPPSGWTPSSAAAAPAPRPATTAPTTNPATAPAAPASAPTAPADAAPPTAPVAPATFLQVASWKGDKLVVDEAAVRDLPEGTIVLLTRP